VKEVLPGEAAQILGFETLPQVGTKITSTVFVQGEKVHKEERRGKLTEGELGISLKAQNAGLLEAILASLPEKVVVIASGIGDLNESDILTAKSSGVKYVFGFDVKIPSQVAKLAEAEGLVVENFKIIYELFQKLEEIINKGHIEEFGKAEVIAEFPFNDKRVAGCKVNSGKIGKTDAVYLVREEKQLGKIKILSLKKQKTEVNEVRQGEEFGAFFAPQLDFQKGDMLVSKAS
jgi:translation initiation factor IF-2